MDARVDRLRKIDRDDSALPVKEVVWRQIAMHKMVREPELHVADNLAEYDIRLVATERSAKQHRRGIVLVAEIFHQDSAAGMREDFGHVGARFVERPHGLKLGGDPGSILNVAP